MPGFWQKGVLSDWDPKAGQYRRGELSVKPCPCCIWVVARRAFYALPCSPLLKSVHHTLKTSYTYFGRVKALLDGNPLTCVLLLNTELSAGKKWPIRFQALWLSLHPILSNSQISTYCCASAQALLSPEHGLSSSLGRGKSPAPLALAQPAHRRTPLHASAPQWLDLTCASTVFHQNPREQGLFIPQLQQNCSFVSSPETISKSLQITVISLPSWCS